LNFGDIGIVGVSGAEVGESSISLVSFTKQLVIASHAYEGFLVFGIREEDLLPDLYGQVRTSAIFLGVSIVDERLTCLFRAGCRSRTLLRINGEKPRGQKQYAEACGEEAAANC
jgi:hypothetical protein